MAKSEKRASPDKAQKSTPAPHSVTPEQRDHYVEVAAYYIAERRGFAAGFADEDWAQAELEIDSVLAAGKLNQ
jgi:hypothetical protein